MALMFIIILINGHIFYTPCAQRLISLMSDLKFSIGAVNSTLFIVAEISRPRRSFSAHNDYSIGSKARGFLDIVPDCTSQYFQDGAQ